MTNILHFAPEPNLIKRIEQCILLGYVQADLNPFHDQMEEIDATQIPYENNSFDWIICNHVLEHIYDYKKALQEIHRVLKQVVKRFCKHLSQSFYTKTSRMTESTRMS